MQRLALLLATWWGAGYSPLAPGTAGTIAAIPFFLLLSLLPLPGYLASVLVIGLVACWAAGKAEHIFQEQDSSHIVIDEAVGFLVTMTAIPPQWPYLVTGFCLFRCFDILKPPPIRFIERTVKGGYGVVLDDVMAGIYAQIAVRLLSLVIPFLSR